MFLFFILFFILFLGNCGVFFILNFVGEFMFFYGVFESLFLLGVFVSLFMVFFVVYIMYMFNSMVFGGLFSKFFEVNMSDVNSCEFFILFMLVMFMVVLGMYFVFILDGLYYLVLLLMYNN